MMQPVEDEIRSFRSWTVPARAATGESSGLTARRDWNPSQAVRPEQTRAFSPPRKRSFPPAIPENTPGRLADGKRGGAQAQRSRILESNQPQHAGLWRWTLSPRIYCDRAEASGRQVSLLDQVHDRKRNRWRVCAALVFPHETRE